MINQKCGLSGFLLPPLHHLRISVASAPGWQRSVMWFLTNSLPKGVEEERADGRGGRGVGVYWEGQSPVHLFLEKTAKPVWPPFIVTGKRIRSLLCQLPLFLASLEENISSSYLHLSSSRLFSSLLKVSRRDRIQRKGYREHWETCLLLNLQPTYHIVLIKVWPLVSLRKDSDNIPTIQSK